MNMKTLICWALLVVGTVGAYGQAQEKIVNAYGTVPELLQLNPNRYNNVVAVQGLSTTTDGQGGVFAYFPTSITATNTTNVFKPVAYDGRWVRMFPSLGGSGADTIWTSNTDTAITPVLALSDIPVILGGSTNRVQKELFSVQKTNSVDSTFDDQTIVFKVFNTSTDYACVGRVNLIEDPSNPGGAPDSEAWRVDNRIAVVNYGGHPLNFGNAAYAITALAGYTTNGPGSIDGKGVAIIGNAAGSYAFEVGVVGLAEGISPRKGNVGAL